MGRAKPPLKPLNARQEAFAVAYVECGCASEASRRAGYKSAANVHGPRLLSNVRIKARIAELAKPIENRRLMSAREAQERLAEIARGEVAETRPGDRIRALELVSKMHGLLIDRTENDHRLEITVRRGADAPAALSQQSRDDT